MTIEIWMSIVGISMVFGVLPQAYRMWKREKSNDLSIPFWILVIHGLAWWLYYGIIKGSICLIITNGIGLIIDIGVLIMIIVYRQDEKIWKNHFFNEEKENEESSNS